MKKVLSLGVVCLFIGMAAMTLSGSQDRGGSEGIRDRFVGAWRLAWLEEQGADGKVHKADCTGLLVYTRDGHMSVQVMYRNPPTGTTAAPVQYAQGGYEASFGTYEIDESTYTFTFHVEGALVRTRIRVIWQTADREVDSPGGTLESCLGALLGRLPNIARKALCTRERNNAKTQRGA